MNQKIENLKGKLIVSCQALPAEPLHSSFIMGRMALAAKIGGAAGIRANTAEDIREIQKQVDLPIIGIVKRDYDDSRVYITPTELSAVHTARCRSCTCIWNAVSVLAMQRMPEKHSTR